MYSGVLRCTPVYSGVLRSTRVLGATLRPESGVLGVPYLYPGLRLYHSNGSRMRSAGVPILSTPVEAYPLIRYMVPIPAELYRDGTVEYPGVHRSTEYSEYGVPGTVPLKNKPTFDSRTPQSTP